MRIIKADQLYQLTFLPHVFPINAYVYEQTDALIVFDMGVPQFVKAVQRLASQTGKPVTHLLLTHGHGDHVSGVAAFERAFPDAQIILSARDARILRGDHELDSTEPQLPLKGGWPPLNFTIHREVQAGDWIAGFKVVAVPGHTPGSVAYVADDGTVIAGDSFQSRGGLAVAGDLRWRFPFLAWATWSPEVALASAQVLLALQPRVLALGHGPLVLNPAVELPPVIERMEGRLQS